MDMSEVWVTAFFLYDQYVGESRVFNNNDPDPDLLDEVAGV